MGTAHGGRGALVIGATGTVGRHVVEGLGQTGTRVRAMTRSPDTARVPPGVEVVQGDLTVPETLDRCVDGVDAVFLVWTAPQSTSDAALERIAKRARRIVFLSAPLKTPHPFFQQPNPARTLGLHLEALIERSGLEWTMLRPGMFAANAREFWGPQVRGGDVVRWPYLEAPTAPIDERDIAAVAVRALTETGHGGKDYVITGPAVVNMLLDAWAAALGQPAYVTSTVEEVTASPPRTFHQWVTDNAAAFQSRPRERV